MSALRSLLTVLWCAGAACTLALLTAEALALAGIRHDGYTTALVCFWLLVVFQIQRSRAMRRINR